MRYAQAHTGDDQHRLRFVFNDGAISFRHSGEITYGDVAHAFDELARKRSDNPIRIDLARMPPRLASAVELRRPRAALFGATGAGDPATKPSTIANVRWTAAAPAPQPLQSSAVAGEPLKRASPFGADPEISQP